MGNCSCPSCQELSHCVCCSWCFSKTCSKALMLCHRLTQQGKQQQEPTSMDSTFSAVTQLMPNTDKNTAAANVSSEYSDMPCTEAGTLQGAIQFGSDPAEVTSPVKRTPMPEVPANDGFHRTFQPFDMLRSPTSLGGNSFQDLNAHLAQNARLSTRQRSFRHALRTATKEYVPADEPPLRGMQCTVVIDFCSLCPLLHPIPPPSPPPPLGLTSRPPLLIPLTILCSFSQQLKIPVAA